MTAGGARLGTEAGFTLIELLVTVVILGIAFVVFVGGMGTAIVASDYHRRAARAEPALRAFAEALKTTGYVACAAPTTKSYLDAYTAPSGYSRTITAVRFWDGNTTNPQYVDAASNCPVSDNGLQRLSLRVTSMTGRASATVNVIKRQP